MSTLRRRGACLGVALACSWGASYPGTSRAEPSSGAVESDVEALVQRGIALRRSGRDAEALTVFRSALVQAPASARVKAHLASTHQALGQWVEAERYLTEALLAQDDPYVRRHRSTLERARDFVDQRLGSLDVVGGPAGAEVLLSGRVLGRLPLAEPVRVPIGAYVLEVRKPGHWGVSRPVSISARALLRESVVLGARNSPGLAAKGPVQAAAAAEDGGPSWVTWTLGGAGAGALALSVASFALREKHAARWNSAECTAPGLTRGRVCPGELESGRTAERWGIGAAIASGLLFGGAATSYFLERREARPDALSLEGCSLAGAGARCFGSF